MPFKSKAQMRWMYATNPEMAKDWTKEQKKSKGKKSFKRLPEYKGESFVNHYFENKE